jgi:hypothetical protein
MRDIGELLRHGGQERRNKAFAIVYYYVHHFK